MSAPSYSAADDGEGRDGDVKAQREAGGDTAWSRWYKLIAACLVVLCVILLIVIIVLSNKDNNLKTENKLTCNNNLTIEKDQLKTCNNNLTIEKDQLKTCNNNLIIEKDHLKTCNNNLIIAREQLQREREQLQRERAELERFLKLGWTYSSSSVYIIINEQKSWTESRQNCRERGADLVIITNREEQEFVTKLRGSGKRAWIGLRGRDSENKWKWVDDTTLITGFWGSGEPNSKAGDADCVITGETSDPVNNWGDDPCSKQYNWICEKTIFN